MADAKLTLITKHESSISSTVEQKEANDFLEFEVKKVMSAHTNGKKQDLIDDIEWVIKASELSKWKPWRLRIETLFSVKKSWDIFS